MNRKLEHRVLLGKLIPGKEFGYKVRVRLVVCAGVDNENPGHPYFTVGCDMLVNGRVRACGCMHDKVLEHWPELAPVVALHLCDINGAPMHTEANGWHWLGIDGGERNDQHLANHLRVPVWMIADIRQHCTDREKFQQAINGMRPRWKAEADAAIALLDTLAVGGY